MSLCQSESKSKEGVCFFDQNRLEKKLKSSFSYLTTNLMISRQARKEKRPPGNNVAKWPYLWIGLGLPASDLIKRLTDPIQQLCISVGFSALQEFLLVLQEPNGRLRGEALGRLLDLRVNTRADPLKADCFFGAVYFQKNFFPTAAMPALAGERGHGDIRGAGRGSGFHFFLLSARWWVGFVCQRTT